MPRIGGEPDEAKGQRESCQWLKGGIVPGMRGIIYQLHNVRDFIDPGDITDILYLH